LKGRFTTPLPVEEERLTRGRYRQVNAWGCRDMPPLALEAPNAVPHVRRVR
jgi:hypothetical protein